MPLEKFLIEEEVDIKKYYDTNGYAIVKNLLPEAKIDRFITSYEVVKNSRSFVYFAQDIHIPTRPKLTPEGFIENSILNPANLKLWKQFSQSLEECLVDQGISHALNILSGGSSHAMMQNMFFDKSTGTIEHQDHYYLDSNPPGKMVATWYALEDIHEDAGCFFVLPGSHKGKVVERGNTSNFSDHDTFVKEINSLISEGQYEYRSFPLNKGDVLFWHPYTIHSAYNNRDPHFSRKSLTAHYYPSDLKPMYAEKLPSSRKTTNPNISIANSQQECYVSNAMHYLRYVVNHIKGRGPDYDMRRDSYGK